jgi:hypothetical protein
MTVGTVPLDTLSTVVCMLLMVVVFVITDVKYTAVVQGGNVIVVVDKRGLGGKTSVQGGTHCTVGDGSLQTVGSMKTGASPPLPPSAARQRSPPV